MTTPTSCSWTAASTPKFADLTLLSAILAMSSRRAAWPYLRASTAQCVIARFCRAAVLGLAAGPGLLPEASRTSRDDRTQPLPPGRPATCHGRSEQSKDRLNYRSCRSERGQPAGGHLRQARELRTCHPARTRLARGVNPGRHRKWTVAAVRGRSRTR